MNDIDKISRSSQRMLYLVPSRWIIGSTSLPIHNPYNHLPDLHVSIDGEPLRSGMIH